MIFKLNRKVEKGEQNDKMTCESKSKALLSINLDTHHVNGMTPPFDSSGKTCLNNWFDLVAIWTSSQDNKIVIVSSTSSQKLAENLLSDWSLQFMRCVQIREKGDLCL